MSGWMQSGSRQLKAKEAIPALQQKMSHHPFAGRTAPYFCGDYGLDNDFAGKALSRSESPRFLLSGEDAGLRYRATLMLRNIASPTVRKGYRIVYLTLRN